MNQKAGISKRSLAAVATDLNGRLKQCCKSADSPSGAALEMRHEVLVRRRLAFEQQHGPDVHVGAALLQREEGGVEP